MRIGEHQQVGSIIANQLAGIELPDFVVLTGPNGVGKTNLLTGLASPATIPTDLNINIHQAGRDIRLFLTGQLTLSAPPVNPDSLRNRWANGFEQINNLVTQSRGVGLQGDAQRESWVRDRLVDNSWEPTLIDRLLAITDSGLLDLTIEQFRMAGPLMGSGVDPFAVHLGEIFVSWALRQRENEFARFLVTQRSQDATYLEDDEFRERFGDAPWDVLNKTLEVIGLEYRFLGPSQDELALNYVARLERSDGVLVSTDVLSSGEQVLVSIARSLFTGAWETESVHLPKLLLLDEPDASLHPSMAQSLLRVIREIIVKEFGVKVVMTTHSPSTVALADEDSLYIMDRSEPRLRPAASVDDALRTLTVGVPTLSVRVENRRQVFVEAEDDQDLYGRLFSILRPNLRTERTAEFISVGDKSTGGGVNAVLRIVAELQGRGATTVLGLIDRDNRTEPPAPNIYQLADRYSLENLVLDPLLLGTFMLRENYALPEALGLPAGTTHMALAAEHMQPIIDAVTSAVGLTADPIAVAYANGESAQVPRAYLDCRGHELADPGRLILTAWPKVNAAVHKGLMQEVVRTAAVDHSGFIPQSLLDLFESMLA